MTDEAPHPGPRARPVADLPLDTLTGRADELARAWAVALIIARDPSAIAEIPLEDLARDGPPLCAQLLRALASDAELARLTEAPAEGRDELASASRLASLAGAGDIASAIAAVEALRGVLWEALLGELRRPVLDRADTHLLADLSDRLAFVCSMALSAALPGVSGRDHGIPGRGAVIVAGGEDRPATPGREPPRAPPAGGGGEVVIVDERPTAPSSPRVVVAREARRHGDADPDAEPRWRDEAGKTDEAGWRDEAGRSNEAPRRDEPTGAWDWASASSGPERDGPASAGDGPAGRAFEVRAREDLSSVWDQPPAPARAAVGEIEIRDERVEEGPAAWIRSIGRELDRFAHEGRPFAVLLIELMEIEHLNRSEQHGEVLHLAHQVERALEVQVRMISDRTPGSLTREAPGRFWLTSPGIDALGVQALAEQVTHAVRRSVSHRGRPLEVAVGTAVCPDDGVQAAALAAHADVALYAARAGGSAGGGAAR